MPACVMHDVAVPPHNVTTILHPSAFSQPIPLDNRSTDERHGPRRPSPIVGSPETCFLTGHQGKQLGMG